MRIVSLNCRVWIRDSGQALSHDLAALVGLYVEIEAN